MSGLKRFARVRESRTDYHELVIWLLPNMLPAAYRVVSRIPNPAFECKIYICACYSYYFATHTHGTPATVYIHCSLFYYSVSIGIGYVEGHGHVEHVDGERHHLLTQILCMTAVCVRVARSKPSNRPFNTERNAQPMIDPGTNCWTFFFILFTSASAFTSSIHTTHSCYNIEIYILYISVVAISFAYQKSGDNAVIAACTFRPSAEMHHRCRPATSAVMLKHVFFFLFHSLLVSVLFPPRSPPPPLVEHFFFLVVLCRPLHFIAIAENTFVFFSPIFVPCAI